LIDSAEGNNSVRPTSDRETTKAPFVLESASLADSGLWADDYRVENEAVLVALDLAHHLCLVFGGAVVVDDTKTA